MLCVSVLSGRCHSSYADTDEIISLRWGYRHHKVGHPGLHHTYIEVNPFQVKRLLASLLAVHHARLLLPTSLVPAAARVVLSAGVSSYFTALASSSFCQNLTTISHICSAGRQLLHGLHGFVPSGLI